MRGAEPMNPDMFSYVDIDARIPKDHVIRRMRVFVDAILQSMSPEFDARYSHIGRPSIPPERLLRALLIQVLYTVCIWIPISVSARYFSVKRSV